MSDELPDPPESERFDDVTELAVDGRVVLRIEEPSELQRSVVDEAVVAVMLLGAAEEIREDVEETHGMTTEEILEQETPDVAFYDSDADEWTAGGGV